MKIKKTIIEKNDRTFSIEVFLKFISTSLLYGITAMNDGEILYGPEPFSIFQFGKYDTFTM